MRNRARPKRTQSPARTVNPTTGAVTGSLAFTDPDGDPLTYTATTAGGGTVSVTGNGTNTASYVYTPSTAQRAAAAAICREPR